MHKIDAPQYHPTKMKAALKKAKSVPTSTTATYRNGCRVFKR
jgi:hypothetical protein